MIKKCLIALSLIAVAGLLVCLCSCNSIYYPNANRYSVGDAEFSEKIENLDIDWLDGSVEIRYGEGDTLKITETVSQELKEDKQLHYLLEDGTLYVKYCESGSYPIISFGPKTGKKLIVTLPAGQTFGSLTVDVSSATVDCDPITAENVKLDSASGNLYFNVVSAKYLFATCASGSIDATVCDCEKAILQSSSGKVSAVLSGTSDTFVADTASGGIDCRLATVGEVHLDSGSGSISVEAALIERSINAHSASGKLTANVAKCEDATFDTASGAIIVNIDDTINDLKIDTASGAVTVFVPEGLGFRLKVDTASGDFNYDIPLVKDGKDYVAGDGTAAFDIGTASGDIAIMKK